MAAELPLNTIQRLGPETELHQGTFDMAKFIHALTDFSTSLFSDPNANMVHLVPNVPFAIDSLRVTGRVGQSRI
jgi:hypothetical protein